MSDLKSILAGELRELSLELAALTPGVLSGDEVAIEQSLTLCERLGRAADLLQMPALQEFAIFLMSNVAATAGVGSATHTVDSVCVELHDCLNVDADATQVSANWAAMSAKLVASEWASPMASESAEALLTCLRALDEIESDAPAEPPTLALADLTLSPSADVSPETWQAYLAETPRLAAELSKMFASGGDNSIYAGAAQRLVHTIKGSSSLVGLQAIVHLAHAIETAVQEASAGVSFDALRADQLSQAADMIEALIEMAALGEAAPAELLDLIQSLYGAAMEEISEERPHFDVPELEVPELEVPELEVLESAPDGNAETVIMRRPPRILEQFRAAQSDNQVAESVANATGEANSALSEEQVQVLVVPPSIKPALTIVPPPASSEAAPTLNVPITVIDDNLRRTGELNTAIAQIAAQVSETLRRADHLTQQLGRVQGQVYELETLVDTRGVPAVQRKTPEQIEGFDPLELDEYSALHSLSRAFSESTLDSREMSRELAEELLKLQNLLAQHTRLARELSESVTSARLVPVATIAPRIERVVRQTARQTEREVELIIHGRELSIDTDILNGLMEPLMHALRNAIDHGIELPADRVKANKPQAGRVELTFKREGNRIEVRVQDDGRGLDFEAIARRAHEKGLLPDGRPVNERDLTQLIFAPGFSTRESVGAISGRGIGMDVVRASVEKLKGTVHFEGKPGIGCTLLLRLPLSLTSQHTLFVAIGDCVYGLPSTTVEQVLYSDAGSIVSLGDSYAFEYGGQISPLYSLGGLLNHDAVSLDVLQTTPMPIVLIRGDDGLVALVIDRALDSRQIVIKGLSPMLPSLPGVAGAAVLPDGGIGIILEVRELLRSSGSLRATGHADAASVRMTRAAADSVPAKQTRRALVVDDSLSARRGLAQLLGDAGYTVSTAVDGIDALTQMEGMSPDLIVVDMEMPRMNGLELTAHVRGNSLWRDVPIVMITSRAADKHRKQALRTGVNEYLTKPYQEHELMDRLFSLAPP